MPAPWLTDLLATVPAFVKGSWARAELARIADEAGNGDKGAAVLIDPGSVVIATGQQPAVGGGPLYTLVKTAHAIAVADALSAAGQPAVPVFWCASEDHDLGEAGHADFIGRDGRIVRVAPGLGAGGQSLRFRLAGGWWDAVATAAKSTFGPGIGEDFLAAHKPWNGETLGAWQCRLLRAVFDETKLVAIEGHRLRPLWPKTIAAALDHWPAAALADLRVELLAQGKSDPFGELDIAPLFADRANGRVKLTVAQARALAATAPLDLSPGAALRPILQQAALPALAYVGGPGELRYHAYITPVYAALGVARPTLIPRASLTLLPTALDRDLRRWGVQPESVTVNSAAPALREPPLGAVSTALADLDRVTAALTAARPADQAGRDSFADGLRRLDKAREALATALARERRRNAALPAFGSLRAQLFPRQLPQDRVMSVFQALWQHGPGLGRQLIAAAAAAGPGGHGLVRF